MAVSCGVKMARSGSPTYCIAKRNHANEPLAIVPRWLICDSSPFTSLLYSPCPVESWPQLEQLANRHYDHVILCATDFEFVQDGTRRDAVFRQYQQDCGMRGELARRGMSYRLVGGRCGGRVKLFRH